jgi:hypothetical protein
LPLTAARLDQIVVAFVLESLHVREILQPATRSENARNRSTKSWFTVGLRPPGEALEREGPHRLNPLVDCG